MRRGGSKTYRGSGFLFSLFSSFKEISTRGLSTLFISLKLSTLVPSMVSPLKYRVILLVIVTLCLAIVLRRLEINFRGRGLINLSLTFRFSSVSSITIPILTFLKLIPYSYSTQLVPDLIIGKVPEGNNVYLIIKLLRKYRKKGCNFEAVIKHKVLYEER